MKSKSCRASGFATLSLLATLFSTAACSLIPETLTDAIRPRTAEKADTQIADGVCEAWPATPYSGRDTQETQIGNRANNAARAAYCKGSD